MYYLTLMIRRKKICVSQECWTGNHFTGHLFFQKLRLIPSMSLSNIRDLQTVQKWKENYLYHLKRLQYFNKGKKLVLKNPPNTARLKHILDLFPNARIIYIYRNPSDVIYSVRRLWEKGLTAFSLQSFDKDMIEDKIFAYYKKFHDAYKTERNLIPPDHLVEIRYEELESDPLAVIKEIYHRFNWNLEGSMARVQDKINEEKRYMKFSYRKDELLDRRIMQELKEYFEEEDIACFNNSIQ